MNIVTLLLALNQELRNAIAYCTRWLKDCQGFNVNPELVERKMSERSKMLDLLLLGESILREPKKEEMESLRQFLLSMMRTLKYYLGDAWGAEQEKMFLECLTMKRIIKHIKVW